jgi:hypothetical protein
MNQIHQGKGEKKNTEILKPKGFICLGKQQQHQAKPNTPPHPPQKKQQQQQQQSKYNPTFCFPPPSCSSTSFFGFLQKPAVSARTGKSKHEISNEDVE